MSKMIEVKETVVNFLKETLKCHDVTVIKIEKVNDTWNTFAEVYEDDSFLKSLNMPSKQIRLFYSVKLDSDLEITFYERLNSFAGMESEGQ